MFKMNRKIEYALIALKHMSRKRPGEISTAKEISDTYGCSFDTIARILQVLAHNGWLHSTQGVSGGYIIIKDLAKVTFYDLSVLILGPLKLVRCLSSSCHIKQKCNIVSPVQNLNDQLMAFYQSLTVHSLIVENQRPAPSTSIELNVPLKELNHGLESLPSSQSESPQILKRDNSRKKQLPQKESSLIHPQSLETETEL